MPEGYNGLPSYYTSSAGPITPNLGLSLKGSDPVIAENFVLIDTAFGSVGGSIEINGSVVNSPNFVNSATATLSVVGSNISITASGGTVNAQTGTSYALVDGDSDRLVTFNNASATAVTIPQAGASSAFLNGWKTYVENLGTGLVTITPVTSTINGMTAIVLGQFQSATIFSDGANYDAFFTKIASTDQASSLSSYVTNDAGLGAAQNQIAVINRGATSVNTKRKGLNVYLEHNGSQVGANYDGLQVNVGFTVDANSSATTGHSDAVEFYSSASGSGITIPEINVVKARSSILNGAHVSDVTGFLLYLPQVDATSTVDNYYGFFIDTPAGGGTVTNWLGVGALDPGSAVTNTHAYGAAFGGKSGAIVADIVTAGQPYSIATFIGHGVCAGLGMPFALYDGWYSGTGSPAGVLAATPGSIASNQSGGAGASFYVKESGTGTSGWAAVLTSSSITLPVTIAAVTSNWLNSYSSITGIFTATQPTFADLSSHPTTLAGYGITDAISSGVMTTLGDIIYENATPAAARLGGNTTTTKMYLQSTGASGLATAPQWAQVSPADLTTGALPNGTTATTQTAGDNSTKLATTAYVGTAIGALVLPATAAATSHKWLNSYTASTGAFTETQPAAADLSDAATSGNYLRGNGTSFVSATIQAGDVPTLNQNTTGTAANLSGTPALPNGTTATTQTAGDNSTKLATTAYVATAAGAYLPLAGGTMTGVLTLESSAAGLKDSAGSAGSSGNVLTVNGSGNPVWAAPATSGTVTSFSAGGLSPLFTTSVATATSTPALTFSLSNAAGGTVFGNNTTGAAGPAFTIAPVLGIPGTSTGSIALASSTASGKFTITAPASTSTPTLTLPTTSNVLAGQFAGDGVIFNSTLNTASAAGTLTPTLLPQTANFVLAGPTSGSTLAPTFRALVAADIPSSANLPLWSNLQNAVGNLTLANAAYTTTFNQTSAVAWLWANTTAAISGTAQSSPLLKLAGSSWSGAAAVTDTWTIQNVNANSTTVAGSSYLTFVHSGSVGPNGVAVGFMSTAAGGVSPTVNGGIAFGTLATNATSLASFGATAIDTFAFFPSASTSVNSGMTIGLFTNDGTTNNQNTWTISTTANNGGNAALTIQAQLNQTGQNMILACAVGTFITNPGITLGGNGGNNNKDFSATSGTQVSVSVGGSTPLGRVIFNPTSGAANFCALQVAPTINQTSTASGSYTALKIAVTETALLGSANKLIDCYAGSAGTTEVFAVDNSGKVTEYAGNATVKAGVPSILAAPTKLTGQQAAQSAVSLVASAAAGMWRISYVAYITQVDTVSSVLGGVTGFAVNFTDPDDSVAKTSNPTTPTISAGNTTGTTISGDLYVYAKAATAITYNFGYTTNGSGATAMSYSIAAYAEYLG